MTIYEWMVQPLLVLFLAPAVGLAILVVGLRVIDQFR